MKVLLGGFALIALVVFVLFVGGNLSHRIPGIRDVSLEPSTRIPGGAHVRITAIGGGEEPISGRNVALDARGLRVTTPFVETEPGLYVGDVVFDAPGEHAVEVKLFLPGHIDLALRGHGEVSIPDWR